MDALASRIEHQLKASNYCTVYERELSRVWPMSDKDRERKIDAFALAHRLQVVFHKAGLYTIFVRYRRSSTGGGSAKEKRERQQLRDAVKWLKKMEQRCTKQIKVIRKQRKQVEARYRKSLQSAHKVSKRYKQEKTILRMRQGRFVDKAGQRHPPMTLQEIGHYWNITRERVRQIEKTARKRYSSPRERAGIRR
jgi:Sigma-70, region 4